MGSRLLNIGDCWNGHKWLGASQLELESSCIQSIRPLDLDSGKPLHGEDWLSYWAIPGFVNSHVHLDLSWQAEVGDCDLPFEDWLWGVKEKRDRLGPEGLSEIATSGIQQCLKAGTTTLVNYDVAETSLQALSDSPIRRLILSEQICLQSKSPDQMKQLEAFLSGGPSRNRHDPVDIEVRGIAPHAPYTLHPTYLSQLMELVQEEAYPWSMHLAEQKWEADFLLKGEGPFARMLKKNGFDLSRLQFPGKDPVPYLLEQFPSCEGGLLVHCNYLSESDLDLLEASNAAVVYCPQSHAFFKHSNHPAEELLQRKIPLVLGTDGLLSSGSLSMLAELRQCQSQHSSLPVEKLFQMLTTDAHKALGGRFGSGELASGQPADFQLYKIPEAARAPGLCKLQGLMDEACNPTSVVIGGEIVIGI